MIRTMRKLNAQIGVFTKTVRFDDAFTLSAKEKVQVLRFLEQQPVMWNDLSCEHGIMDFSFNGIWYTLENFNSDTEELLLTNYKL